MCVYVLPDLSIYKCTTRNLPWRRKWQPTPVVLPGESPGQRSLAGYSPWSQKESDKTEHTCMRAHAHTHTHTYTLTYTFYSICHTMYFSFLFFL